MQVFKLCMKIFKRNLPDMMIYMIIFLLIAVVVSFSNQTVSESIYSDERTDVAFFSSENTPLVKGLKQELAKSVNFVDLPDQTEALQDALYFRKVRCIFRIPKGFTEQFLRGENVKIETTTVPDSYSETYVNQKIDRYFNTARLYLDSQKGITQTELVQHLKSDLAQNAPVTLESHQTTEGGKGFTLSDSSYTSFYIIYLAYVLPAILISGIGTIMVVFNRNRDLKRRSFCSSFPAGKFNRQFLLANGVFSLVCWVVLLVPCAILDPKNFFTVNAGYMVLNSFVFLLGTVAFSFLIGNLLKNFNAISAACNIFSLGPCFIGGVFISQQYLNSKVLKIASFTPTYWYVLANNRLANLTRFDYASLAPSLSCMGVELAFAFAFLALALASGKQVASRD